MTCESTQSTYNSLPVQGDYFKCTTIGSTLMISLKKSLNGWL